MRHQAFMNPCPDPEIKLYLCPSKLVTEIKFTNSLQNYLILIVPNIPKIE